MTIHKLEHEFIGTGEVREFKFTQINFSSTAYFYKVETSEGSTHYEVFLKKTVPICLNFEDRIYSETEFKEVYPKSNAFGVSAWCITDYNKAIKKFESLINEV